jgi:hypothetical protein
MPDKVTPRLIAGLGNEAQHADQTFNLDGKGRQIGS